MKKTIMLSTLLLCFSLFSFSQELKNHVSISFGGNYNYSSSINKNSDENFLTSKGGLLNASVGYFFSNNINLGVGINMNWNTNESVFNIFISDIKVTTKSRSYLPYIYGSYYIRIFNNFYFVPTLRVSYGKTYQESEYPTSNFSFDPSGAIPISYVNSQETTQTDYNYFGISLIPELNYQFSKYFGAYLTLGVIEYNQQNNDNTKQPKWDINFSPAYWNVGFRVIL